MVSFLLIVLVVIISVIADQTFYKYSSSAYLGYEYLDLTTSPTINVEIILSKAFLSSGSADDVYATYIGDFSSSGPHLFSNKFADINTNYKEDIKLERQIGTLQSIYFEIKGTDNLLLDRVICQLDGEVYILHSPMQFLARWDIDLARNLTRNNNQGSGYEELSIPSSSTLLVSVNSSYTNYDDLGIFFDE